MIKTVFLDLDGVLVNFLGGLHKALNAPYQYDPYPYKKGLWNMLEDIKNLDKVPVTFDMCNKCCTAAFWSSLEWIHDGHDILRMVASIFHPEQIYLLTTPMPNPGSGTGKILWVEKHIPKYRNRLFITAASKSVIARPDTLLIDDRDKNVEDFCAAGGYGILVKRPWNKGYERANHTVEELELDLLDIKHNIGVTSL